MDLDLPDWMLAALAQPAPPAPALRVLPPRFRCPACGRCSSDPNDIAERYCGRCHWWTGDPDRAWQRPDLFTANGVVPPGKPGTILGLSVDQVIIDEVVAG